MAESSYRRIEAVRKAGEILKHLAAQKAPCSGPDIARAVNLPTATVMSHLATLMDLGFVRQVGGDGFEIGMGLALMWARVKSNLEGQRERVDRDIESISIKKGDE